jgi:hypothetical protein
VLGHEFFILWSVELPEWRTPWSVGNVPYKRGGQVGTSSIHVGIITKILGRPHYSSSRSSCSLPALSAHSCCQRTLLSNHSSCLLSSSTVLVGCLRCPSPPTLAASHGSCCRQSVALTAGALTSPLPGPPIVIPSPLAVLPLCRVI